MGASWLSRYSLLRRNPKQTLPQLTHFLSTAPPASTSSSSSTPGAIPSTSMPADATASSTSDPPALPNRPSALNSVVNQTAANYSPYGQSRLAPSTYGGYGAYSSYSSPYSRFGGMGSMYGGYGGMYGGMAGGMGGMYGGGYGGMPGDPNDPNSLTVSFNQSTQATFQIIESIVQAFGGFAQMLESTYMATHSSFFGMLTEFLSFFPIDILTYTSHSNGICS